MTKNEAREWLRKNTGMELPDDDEINAKDEMDQQIAKTNQQFQKEKFVNKFSPISLNECKCNCASCKEGQHTFCTGKKRSCQ